MRNWFVEMRKKANLTQQNVADKVGVTRQMISAIEKGEAEPSVTTAKALGNLLGFSWTRFYESSA